MDLVIDFIEEMQARIGTAQTFVRVCRFMMAYLELFVLKFPEVAKDALAIAKRVRLGELPVNELERARVRCWDFLDGRAASTDFSDPEICAIRAVICVLYEESPSEDVAELLAWFLTLMEKIDGKSTEVIPDLMSYFTQHENP